MASAPSVAGGDGVKRKRLTRTVQKEEKQVVAGLSNMFEDDDDEELTYIIEELRGPKRQHISRVYKMLKKGTLDKLDATGDADDYLEERLQRYQHLKVEEAIRVLVALEPQLDGKQSSLKERGRPVLLKWITFALGKKEHQELPKDLPTLRMWSPLLEFLKLGYAFLGRRIKGLAEVEEITAATLPGYFTADTANNRIISCTEKDDRDRYLSFPLDMSGATDWSIDKPFSRDCCIKSEELDQMTRLANRLQKATGRVLFSEDDEWDLPNPLPQSIIAAVVPEPAAATASPSGGAARPPPPRGTGRARRPPSARSSSEASGR